MEYYTTSLQHILAEKERIELIIQRPGITLCLDEMARLFHFTPFDMDTIPVCLSPALNMRYKRLYIYLQDHLTKKRSMDLVLKRLKNKP